MARPDERNPAPHRYLRHRPGGVPGAGVVRLHRAAVLAAGQELRGLLHRRRRDHPRQRRQRVRHQGRQGDVGRAGRRLGQGDVHRRPQRQGRRPVPGGDQDRHRARPEVAGGDAARAAAARRSIPLGRTTTPYTLNTALQDLGQNAERARQAEVRAGAADADRHAARRDPAAARRARRRGRTCRAASTSATRRSSSCSPTPRRCPTRWPSAPARSTS